MKNEIFYIIYAFILYSAGFCFGYITEYFKERQKHYNKERQKRYKKGYAVGIEAFHKDLCGEEINK